MNFYSTSTGIRREYSKPIPMIKWYPGVSLGIASSRLMPEYWFFYDSCLGLLYPQSFLYVQYRACLLILPVLPRALICVSGYDLETAAPGIA